MVDDRGAVVHGHDATVVDLEVVHVELLTGNPGHLVQFLEFEGPDLLDRLGGDECDGPLDPIVGRVDIAAHLGCDLPEGVPASTEGNGLGVDERLSDVVTGSLGAHSLGQSSRDFCRSVVDKP